MDEEIAGAYEVVLRGSYLLGRHYPNWFAEHVDGRVVTLGQGIGVICAFLQLVERDVCRLRWPDTGLGGCYGDYRLNHDLEPTPEETLTTFNWANPEWLYEEVRYYVIDPRPKYYGLGVQSILDTGLDCYNDSPFVAMLWRLFSQTSLSIGRQHVESYFELGLEAAEQVFTLKPLPGDTPIRVLLDFLRTAQIPGHSSNVTPDRLIRYAFGQTDNTLADYSNYEAEQRMDVDIWDWSHLDRLRNEARDAQAIAVAFSAWDRSIQESPNPLRQIRRIAAWLRWHARQAKQPQIAPPNALYTILARQEELAA